MLGLNPSILLWAYTDKTHSDNLPINYHSDTSLEEHQHQTAGKADKLLADERKQSLDYDCFALSATGS